MRRKYVLGLACCLLLTSVVQARNLSATPVQQPTQGPLAQGYYPPSLHRMDDVSKSLKLNPEQMKQLNEVTKKTQDKYNAQYSKLNKLNDAERAARLHELDRQYYQDWNKTAAEILNPEQKTRYLQLYRQYGGFNSLNDPDVQKRLNLTPEQVKTLRENVEWNNRMMHNIRVLGTTNPTKAGQLYNEYWKERQQRFDSFLTSAQQQLWREMTGDPYLFRPNFNEPR